MSIFLWKGERKELEERIEARDVELVAAKQSETKAIANKEAVFEAAKKVTKERDELKKMVREQTEADLLINALKSVGIIKEYKAPDYFARDSQLRDRMASAQQMSANVFSGLSGLQGFASIAGYR